MMKLKSGESESEKDQKITENAQTSFTKAFNPASCDSSVPISDTRASVYSLKPLLP
jgi:hypothetical protein